MVQFLKPLISAIFDFAVKLAKCPRFWTKKEWRMLTPKEKLWIWYKHQLAMIGAGEGEINIYEQLATSMISLITLMIVAGLVNYIWAVPIIFIGLKIIKWKVGNWKDSKDLIALETEISNKRNIFCRDLRKKSMKAAFRQNL